MANRGDFMEKRNNIGKYMLVFEPKYVYHQYAIYFTGNGDVDITKVKKYSFEPYDEIKRTPKKNLLGDIDKITASCNNLSNFFSSYVDPKIFNYRYHNLHRMFIGYAFNRKMYTLDYVLNNPELVSKLDLLNGSKIDDYSGRSKMLELIRDSNNNSFLSFIIDKKAKQETNLSSDTLNVAIRYRMCHDNADGFSETSELFGLLDEKLTYYKEYREMFLLKQQYLDSILIRKDELKQLKSQVVASSVNRSSKKDKDLKEKEQLSLFDMEHPKVISKKDDFYN